ncbi:hypothetical protein D3C81_472650 [compost metagenome]
MIVWEWIIKGIIHLLGAIKNAAAGIVGKVLATFGLTTVTFNAILPNLKAFVMQYVGQLPSNMVDFLSYLGVGTAMTMILSALTVRMTWKVFIMPKAIADQLPGGGQ